MERTSNFQTKRSTFFWDQGHNVFQKQFHGLQIIIIVVVVVVAVVVVVHLFGTLFIFYV
jgi:hypothetical protein